MISELPKLRTANIPPSLLAICFLLLLSLVNPCRGHDLQLEFEVAKKDGAVCQIFFIHGDRKPILDQCVPQQGVINQNIELVRLTKLISQIKDRDILNSSGIDPLDVYDAAILSEYFQNHIIDNYSRLDIKHLSVIDAETIMNNGNHDVRMHFIARVDWETKSGRTGIYFVEGAVIDLSEETLSSITDDGNYVLDRLASVLKENTSFIKTSSGLQKSNSSLSDETTHGVIAPVIAMELAFVLNLRLLRSTLEFLDGLIDNDKEEQQAPEDINIQI